MVCSIESGDRITAVIAQATYFSPFLTALLFFYEADLSLTAQNLGAGEAPSTY